MATSYCSVPGCISHLYSSELEKKITYHRFPQDPELRRAWLKSIHRRCWEPKEYSLVCSDHFDANAYELSANGKLRLLKSDAMPTLNLNGDTDCVPDKLQRVIQPIIKITRLVKDTTLPIENVTQTVNRITQHTNRITQPVNKNTLPVIKLKHPIKMITQSVDSKLRPVDKIVHPIKNATQSVDNKTQIVSKQKSSNLRKDPPAEIRRKSVMEMRRSSMSTASEIEEKMTIDDIDEMLHIKEMELCLAHFRNKAEVMERKLAKAKKLSHSRLLLFNKLKKRYKGIKKNHAYLVHTVSKLIEDGKMEQDDVSKIETILSGIWDKSSLRQNHHYG